VAEVLRPRDFGDLFTQAFTVTFRALGKLLPIQLLLWGPFLVLALLGFVIVTFLFQGFGAEGETVAVVVTALGTIGGFLLFLVLSPLAQAASILVIAGQFTGNHLSVGDGLRAGLRKAMGLILLGFVLGAAVFVWFVPGTVVLVVGLSMQDGIAYALASLLYFAGMFPAMICFLMLFVAGPAYILEDITTTEALTRSRQLTAGHRLKIFGLAVLFGILIGLLSSVVLVPLAFVQALTPEPFSMAVEILSQGLSQIIGGVLGVGLPSVIYFDLRVRRDGFDLENLAELVDVIQERAAADRALRNGEQTPEMGSDFGAPSDAPSADSVPPDPDGRRTAGPPDAEGGASG